MTYALSVSDISKDDVTKGPMYEVTESQMYFRDSDRPKARKIGTTLCVRPITRYVRTALLSNANPGRKECRDKEQHDLCMHRGQLV